MEILENLLKVQSSGLCYRSSSFNIHPMGNDGKMGAFF